MVSSLLAAFRLPPFETLIFHDYSFHISTSLNHALSISMTINQEIKNSFVHPLIQSSIHPLIYTCTNASVHQFTHLSIHASLSLQRSMLHLSFTHHPRRSKGHDHRNGVVTIKTHKRIKAYCLLTPPLFHCHSAAYFVSASTRRKGATPSKTTFIPTSQPPQKCIPSRF